MARLNFCIFCEYSLVSKQGTPSFIGVFSEVIVKKLPATRGRMDVVVNFFPDDINKHDLIVVVKSPDGGTVKSFPNHVTPAASKESDVGFMLAISNIKFEKEGIYNFEILLDNNKIGTVPLTIKIEK